MALPSPDTLNHRQRRNPAGDLGTEPLPALSDASNEAVHTSGVWLQANERKPWEFKNNAGVKGGALNCAGKREGKRLPGVPTLSLSLSLTQPDAIQRGHSAALLQQDVLLGRRALGLPSDALHDPAGGSAAVGRAGGAVPPLQGSLLIQELRRCHTGLQGAASGTAAAQAGRAGQGRVRLGVGPWRASPPASHAGCKLKPRRLPAAAQVSGTSFPPAGFYASFPEAGGVADIVCGS